MSEKPVSEKPTSRIVRKHSPDEKEVLSKLLVDEKTYLTNLDAIVDSVKAVFVIEHPSGRVIFKNFGEMNDNQRLLALLLGKYFAGRLGLIEADTLGITEIATELGRPKTSLSGPIKELVDDQLVVKTPERKYKIAYHQMDEITGIIVSGGKIQK